MSKDKKDPWDFFFAAICYSFLVALLCYFLKLSLDATVAIANHNIPVQRL